MDKASTSNPSFTVEIGEKYPYPTLNFATNIVALKLSSKNEYNVWNTQMLCLLSSHDMLGFIDGQFPSPSDANGKTKVEDMKAWIRSDSLVKGWILGSLSKQTAMSVVNRLTFLHKKAEFTAKDVWDELQRSYGPSTLEHATAEDAKSEDWSKKGMADDNSKLNKERIYKFILRGKTKGVFKIYGQLITQDVKDYFRDQGLTPTDKITNNGNTALHVAVGSSINSHELLEKLLEMTPTEIKLLDLKNSDGSTLLHVAAIVGNTKAVDILVRRDPELLLAKDNEGHTPLALSLSNVHSETSQCLVNHIKAKGYDALFSGKSGEDLMVLAISSQDFGLALKMHDYKERAHSDAVLMALAQYFPPELNYWERKNDIIDETEEKMASFVDRNRRLFEFIDRSCSSLTILAYIITGMFFIIPAAFHAILKVIVRPFIGDKSQIHEDAAYLLDIECKGIYFHTPNGYHHFYTNPIFEATRQNACKVVTKIVYWFPDAIWSVNEDGHNFIQYSVIHRSEKIYNLLYQMSEHKNIYKTIKDSSGNNLLHLAARLAPSNKLNLLSGAALQIQRELQWFKEVEGFLCPLNRMQKNSDDETPQMVFTREHKDLVIEGEKWIKSTAESYTITAALITTIVFAAAITVPGGNNQESGIPIFTNKPAFVIFALSDAVSLFTSVTSLLMFLSILTARFAEQDFLFKLPKRLIIGLAMLFISTTAMIIAFGATLFLVFGHENLWILIPIGALTCLPITSFVTLQFPLITDLISATYGRSIFVKKNSGRGRMVYGWSLVNAYELKQQMWLFYIWNDRQIVLAYGSFKSKGGIRLQQQLELRTA
ncbi:ankyrin repeat-containing domain, PGG domain, Gag-polypeptide of LTR copia-type [Artemisia annua]|uniref:Ankyrin repeat-containing domain, PGG domain, Gag-polypeptide of LTR copia-type n=1 Tax=Artemisia annua TaxID=35608 RepID=A0A2U1Q2K9_ARTAN|nr:ankyrin repeat-containing domain, PGG domain, Gag-polypeptide of LTR copia-type [Artemisia annua]